MENNFLIFSLDNIINRIERNQSYPFYLFDVLQSAQGIFFILRDYLYSKNIDSNIELILNAFCEINDDSFENNTYNILPEIINLRNKLKEAIQ